MNEALILGERTASLVWRGIGLLDRNGEIVMAGPIERGEAAVDVAKRRIVNDIYIDELT